MPSFVPAAQAFQDSLVGLDARAFSGEDAASGAELLARIIKVAEAARTKLAWWAAECGAHRARGFSTPTEWLARQTGESAGQARRELELVAHLDGLPATKAAFEDGDVSAQQAEEVAKTEAECPGSEAEMLDEAKRRGLRGVKEKGRRKRQEANDPAELARKRRKARSFRTWEDELGMVCGQFALEPHLGVPFLKRLDAEVTRMYRKGDEPYRSEPREARAADALVKLLEGKGKPSTTRPEMVVVADADTGRAHIPGHGPLDPATVRQLARDAIVTLCVHDGEKVTDIKRYTRSYPVAVRLLLEIGPPPDFDGPICVDCGRRYHLQRDHIQALLNDGITELTNLDWRCPHCHHDKTQDDLELWRSENTNHYGARPTTVGERGPP